MLILEPTLQCNSRCLTCYNREKLNLPGASLDSQTVERIVADLPDLLVLEISGGEPFLHPELAGIISLFAARTPVRFVSIPTNGLLTERIGETTRDLCRAFGGFVSIGLSIDGIAQGHDDIRGVPGNFRALCETYERLASLKRELPNLHLSANTCICAYNEGHYLDVLNWVRENWPEVEGHSVSLVRNAGTEEANLDCGGFLAREEGRLAALARRRTGYRLGLLGGMNRVFWCAYYQEAVRHHLGRRRRWACSGGSGSIYIDALAQVHACELFGPIGSLRDPGATLSGILRCPAARAERRKIRARECSCDHSCFLQHSAFTLPSNLGLWLRGLFARPRSRTDDAQS